MWKMMYRNLFNELETDEIVLIDGRVPKSFKEASEEAYALHDNKLVAIINQEEVDTWRKSLNGF